MKSLVTLKQKMLITTLHPCWLHKTHSAFPWGGKKIKKKKSQNNSKPFPSFLSPPPQWLASPSAGTTALAAARSTAAAKAHEQPAQLRPGAWFTVPGPSQRAAARGPDPAPSSPELRPWQTQPPRSSRFVLRNPRPEGLFLPLPASTERPPPVQVGFRWSPIASAWAYSHMEKRHVSYLHINHKSVTNRHFYGVFCLLTSSRNNAHHGRAKQLSASVYT